MKIGLSLTHHAPIGGDPARLREEVLAQVRCAEEHGFDSVFLGHHFLTRSMFLQPLTLAGFLAAATERIRIGFGVYLLTLANPVAIAEELLTLEVLSGGRTIAGFGSGYRAKEFAAFGMDAESRYRRLVENITTIRALWSGESVSVEGAFGELQEEALHLRSESGSPPPLWLGAFGPVGIRRAARHADAWLAPPSGSPQEMAAAMQAFLDAREAAGVGPSTERPLLREGYAALTGDQAREFAEPQLAKQYKDYRSWDHGQSVEDLIRRDALVGDPDQILDRLELFHHAGFDHIIVRMRWGDTPLDATLRSIELFGRHVIPSATTDLSPAREVTA